MQKKIKQKNQTKRPQKIRKKTETALSKTKILINYPIFTAIGSITGNSIYTENNIRLKIIKILLKLFCFKTVAKRKILLENKFLEIDSTTKITFIGIRFETEKHSPPSS